MADALESRYDPSLKDCQGTEDSAVGEAEVVSIGATQAGQDTESISESALKQCVFSVVTNCLDALQSSPALSTISSLTNTSCDSVDKSQGKPQSEMIVGRSVKTRVLQKINSGSFGQIHLGSLITNGQEVAVKLESKQKLHAPQLLNEGNIMRHLEGGPGIPKIHWFGIHEPDYNVMVMDLLGPSLQDLFSYCKHKFSLKTVLMLADQMLDILAFVHKNHYIYRDIKPDNFMIGRGENSHRVYIIDFGLAKKITTHHFSGHVMFNVVHPVVGTVRYASIHAHMGYEETQRDDLESLAYVLIYFLRGRLPWQSIPARTKEEKFALIKDCKLNTSIQMLCEGLPPQFAQFLDTTRQMRREAVVNHCQIKQMFQNLARENYVTYDYQYDWVIHQLETGQEIKARGRSDHGHDSS